MSNSSLVDYTKLSPHCTRPRNGKIRGISIHTMAGPGSVEGCGAVFQTSEASAHYGIGPQPGGPLLQFPQGGLTGIHQFLLIAVGPPAKEIGQPCGKIPNKIDA